MQVFPIATPEQKECFKLLRKAYVDTRYDKNYKITKEQLLYLISRVEKLKQITEKMCLEKINGI
ncbi:MAG: HEPN domain-containing protein [Rickettsia endosymbiont of Ixodes persulcatus]|nr:HEPN domain-containing protein [Rickettsia endosymbiont of Ixodes persulcatus]MCZ6903740.1 HEPN domain-containing protein [Rickettsia endosymbiont of Ixodes persulcatus]MCZ6909388.1 HEPN domain-containing protein [Rickettsia endosymbiont of Ixodes persulcatus]MCZ6914467.1 HEPN domain-containing protein [Rickettsia endosymbiont of Ixodes persulcatus]MCZ6919309.1 HEPN domain-containing protein [Rickettsia endosymbiont of Ixodes persulcatus]